MPRNDAVIEVRKFSELDINDPFFDSLKKSYGEFSDWFVRKRDSDAYVTFSGGKLRGFLALKIEDGPVTDISPPLNIRGQIIKISTFKIDAHGTKLGERFIKKIFDYAISCQSQYMYVTVFPQHAALISLLKQYGFVEHGEKNSDNGTEAVYVKDFISLKNDIELDYPIIDARRNKWLMSVYPKYHVNLFPDSIVRGEPKEIIQDVSFTNSIHKVYVGAYDRFPGMNIGDAIVIYRTKPDKDASAWYTSCATSLCVVEEIRPKSSFSGFNDFYNYSSKFSVFDKDDLRYWYNRKKSLYAVKMTYNAAFLKRPNRASLIQDAGLDPNDYWGLMRLTEKQFFKILTLGCIYEGIIIR